MAKSDDTLWLRSIGSVAAGTTTVIFPATPDRRMRWNITGSGASITSFGTVGNASDKTWRFVTWAAVNTIVHGGRIITQTGANIVTAAGDMSMIYGDAGGDFHVWHFRKTGVPLTPVVTTSWTPVLTFATPGDFSVTYSIQAGRLVQLGTRYMAEFAIATATFTHTTASGAVRITGLPVTSVNAEPGARGTLAYGGIAKTGYTQFGSAVNVNSNIILITAAGSGQAISSVTVDDMPTGGTVILRGSISFNV